MLPLPCPCVKEPCQNGIGALNTDFVVDNDLALDERSVVSATFIFAPVSEKDSYDKDLEATPRVALEMGVPSVSPSENAT